MYGSSGLVLHVTLISGRVLRKFKSGVRKHWTEQDEYGKMDAQEVQEYFIAFAKAMSSQSEKIAGVCHSCALYQVKLPERSCAVSS